MCQAACQYATSHASKLAAGRLVWQRRVVETSMTMRVCLMRLFDWALLAQVMPPHEAARLARMQARAGEVQVPTVLGYR